MMIRQLGPTCLFLCAAVFNSGHVAVAAAPELQKDIAYDDDHPAQRLDVYLAKADQPTAAMVYIHGGGWRAGSKDRLPGWLATAVNEGWLSVVSIEYRFTDVAPHPAQVNDCVRAIQFVRSRAKEWNIDPRRIGVTGGSAGAHLSLWVALHDDAADASSPDPIARHSSRTTCAVSFAGPTDWSLLAEIEHKHPAYRQLLGYEPGTPAAEMSKAAKADVSPISFATSDDPPVLLVHGDNDVIVPLRHASKLHERLKSVGGTTELLVVKGANHGVAGAGKRVSQRAVAFVRKHLKIDQDGSE
ncbi:MAG TPA: alpha/beta hydrolase [Planctomycetes bacterium]|nr:alpha/beta hydrolase [Planctomycetota bacterium]